MLRRKLLRKIYLTTLIIFILFAISSFTFNEYLPNTKVSYATNLSNIFLLNDDNYLVETSILVNDDLEENVQIVFDKLKSDSKYYNGLKGIIPNNTKINKIKIQDNILEIDFNRELLNVNQELEEKVIESLVYSFLEFKELKGIKISINDKPLLNLPKSQIKLNDILTKDFGINKEYSINSFNNVQKVTLYYYQTIDDNNYYVPVTKYLNNKNDKIQVIIDNLKNSYLSQTNLMSYLNEKVKIKNYEYQDNLVTLSFDSLNNIEYEEVIYTLANSIFDSMDVNKVIFLVDDNFLDIKNR